MGRLLTEQICSPAEKEAYGQTLSSYIGAVKDTLVSSQKIIWHSMGGTLKSFCIRSWDATRDDAVNQIGMSPLWYLHRGLKSTGSPSQDCATWCEQTDQCGSFAMFMYRGQEWCGLYKFTTGPSHPVEADPVGHRVFFYPSGLFLNNQLPMGYKWNMYGHLETNCQLKVDLIERCHECDKALVVYA